MSVGGQCMETIAPMSVPVSNVWKPLLLYQWLCTMYGNFCSYIYQCLCLVYAIDGWEITTTEGIGSQRKGFHAIQARIADYSGSQCGFCTPGMVMNMYR